MEDDLQTAKLLQLHADGRTTSLRRIATSDVRLAGILSCSAALVAAPPRPNYIGGTGDHRTPPRIPGSTRHKVPRARGDPVCLETPR